MLTVPIPIISRVHTSQEVEDRMYRQVLTLWQTAMLRLVKLKVTDEVNNGLEFYKRTFLSSIPKLYGALESELASMRGIDGSDSGSIPKLPPFLTVGSWIGGDRDGNPFVNAGGQLIVVTVTAMGSEGHNTLLQRASAIPSCRCLASSS